MSCKTKPAFPIQMPIDYQGNPTGGSEMGLSKRELIAAMALQGLLSNPNVVRFTPGDPCVHESDHVELYAKNKADALLTELEKTS